jgi:HK97 family phage prohead protease
MDRAFTTFSVKRLDAERREVIGIASTPEVDRIGDIVEPSGAQFKLPLPFLWMHRHDEPIGQVTGVDVVGGKMRVIAKLAKIEDAGVLKDRLDEAWQSIVAGLVRGLSIGFSAIESKPISTGLRFVRWSLLEISAVTIAANAEASISAIKSIDAVACGASGNGRSWESCMHESAHITIATHFKLDVTKATVGKPGSGLAFLGSHLQRNQDGYLTAVLAGGIAALGMSQGDRASIQRVAGLVPPHRDYDSLNVGRG